MTGWILGSDSNRNSDQAWEYRRLPIRRRSPLTQHPVLVYPTCGRRRAELLYLVCPKQFWLGNFREERRCHE